MNYSYSYDTNYSVSPFWMIFSLAIAIVLSVAQWRIFTKAGKPGWAALIPVYNTWVLFDILCGNGAKMFFLLIPIFNIYWSIKSEIKLAHVFGKSTAFGIGLVFLPAIFTCILGFGGARYEGPEFM